MDQTSWFFQMVYCRRSRTYSSCICITRLGFRSNLKPEDNCITIAPHIEVAVMIAMASRTIYGSDPTRNWYWPDNYGLARAWYVLNISYFNTTWLVPPAPATYNGQLVYLYTGMKPADYGAILQPILQYGVSPAGGGAYWPVANWYVTETDAYYTSLVDVAVGKAIRKSPHC